jgi:hypothetical protein
MSFNQPAIEGLIVNELPASVDDALRQVVADQDVETQNVWSYLIDNIDEFAVAKSIVDHADAFPEVLAQKDVDYRGLYLRAQVTLKRRQVAYAEAQAAIRQASERTRSVRGRLKALHGFLADVQRALVANPTAVVVAVLGVVMFFGARLA